MPIAVLVNFTSFLALHLRLVAQKDISIAKATRLCQLQSQFLYRLAAGETNEPAKVRTHGAVLSHRLSHPRNWDSGYESQILSFHLGQFTSDPSLDFTSSKSLSFLLLAIRLSPA